ncbi:lytic murein transglycosylase [Candidatus Nomurabacteria bacterium]|nr:lytic murein transglycosylase [Candidatus Nomurabacteria bacterium]
MSLLKRCILFLFIFTFSLGLTPNTFADQLQMAQGDKARLEAELSSLEHEIAQKQRELERQKGQSVSLTRDISILTTQINKSKLDIQAKNLTIKKLGGEIVDKNKKIQSLTEKIESEKESLAQLIRKDRELDDMSILSIALSRASISEMYGDVQSFSSIKNAVKNSVDVIRGVRTETQTQKKTLEEKKDKETDVKVALENEKKRVEQNESEKKKLLSISKNKESEYQKVLAEKAKRKAQILSALFNLRDTGAIPFGRALEYANTASKVTGVRPAFILAIITQESNLGTDQGSCYVTDMSTGAGVSSRSNKQFKNVMKPSRDVPPFVRITTELGRDPAKTLVSCPIGGIGWGGAMGPAQFIPSTWAGMSKKISAALGKATPDPWNAPDAFMASALFLKELGGVNGSYTAEIKAACKYYGTGGSACAYGKQVMTKALKIQTTMIDPLQN